MVTNYSRVKKKILKAMNHIFQKIDDYFVII